MKDEKEEKNMNWKSGINPQSHDDDDHHCFY